VITSARGMSTRLRVSMASGASSRSPDAAIMTGSSTTLRCRQRSSPAAIASITGLCETMPIFTALTARSENTASICAVMKSAGTSWIAVTPLVFCAVKAVITEAP
jgi:hypothetical protein